MLRYVGIVVVGRYTIVFHEIDPFLRENARSYWLKLTRLICAQTSAFRMAAEMIDYLINLLLEHLDLGKYYS